MRERPPISDVDVAIAMPPLTREFFATESPLEAQQFVRRAYGAHRAHLSGRPGEFRLEAGHLHNPLVGIEYLDVGASGHASFGGHRSVYVVQVVGGHLVARSGGVRENLSPGHMALFGPHSEIDIEWRDVQLGFARLDLEAVQGVAQGITGVRPELHLALSRPVGQRQAAHLRATIDHLRRDVFTNPAAASSELVRNHAFGLLAAAVLNTFPSAFLDTQGQESAEGLAASALVRRACAFIDAHAADAIGLPEVVRAARVSPRTLQGAFRRYLETTPTAYLVGVRLERAHDDLLRMDRTRGDTVADVAARWHFSNGGRFARLYAQKYGQSPHDTLLM